MNSNKQGKTRSEEVSEEEAKDSLGLKGSMISLEVVLDKAGLDSRTHSVIYSKNSRNSSDKVGHKVNQEVLVVVNNRQKDKTLL
jgi:hypothetical protein